MMKNAASWHTAWYRRSFTVPAGAQGKQVLLDIEQLQTRATVYVDGKKAGEIVFPGGKLELTPYVAPGNEQTLEIRLSAVPLAEEHYVVMDGNNVTKVAAKVKNKGITGDVFLETVPAARIDGTHFITSVRSRSITFASEYAGLVPGRTYTVRAEIFDRDGKAVRSFDSPPFTAKELKGGRFAFTAAWPDPQLWDLDTPQNLYTAKLTLRSGGETRR